MVRRPNAAPAAHGLERESQVRLSWAGKEHALNEASGDEAPPHVWVAEEGRGLLVHGDNRRALGDLEARIGDSVTLAYLDPPFLTNRPFDALLPNEVRARDRKGPLKARPKAHAFDDRWSSRADYLEALAARLVRIRRLLAPHGSVVVHVDTKTSHYVKVLGDEIFGDESFASEIVWRYRRWPSRTPNFQRVHDVLLRWCKDPEAKPRWNQPYEPLAASTLATWGENKQRAVIEADGRRSRSSTTEERTKGVPMGDVWEIGVLAPMSRERTGYPTQKPEALLERIVGALSDPGDVVLDPYAGSGTTLAVAARMGRSFVGIDKGDVAIDIAKRRLETLGVRFGPPESGTALAPCAATATPRPPPRRRA